MVETIHAAYQKLNTDPNEQVYDVQTILGLNTSLDPEMLNIIASALSKYIASTKKSIPSILTTNHHLFTCETIPVYNLPRVHYKVLL